MTFATWLAFVFLSLATTFSPGPAVMLAMSTTMQVGARRTFYSSAGNGAGILIVSGVALTSVGLLLRTSATAFTALKFCGAAYLIYLGIKQWRRAPQAPSQVSAAEVHTRTGLFTRGVLVAVSNPKAILFFTAVFPQFIPVAHPDPGQFLLLSLTFVACSFVAHLTYVLLAHAISASKSAASNIRKVNQVSALIFVCLGITMLTLSAQI